MCGGFTCKDNFNSLERLHCRAGRIIYGFAKDKSSEDVLKEAKWNTLFHRYKVSLAKLIYKIYYELTPPNMSQIIEKNHSKYNLRSKNKVIVPRFNTYFMKHSIAHRGSILWNALSVHCSEDCFQSVQRFCRMVSKNATLQRMDFNALSVQSIPNFMPDFITY